MNNKFRYRLKAFDLSRFGFRSIPAVVANSLAILCVGAVAFAQTPPAGSVPPPPPPPSSAPSAAPAQNAPPAAAQYQQQLPPGAQMPPPPPSPPTAADLKPGLNVTLPAQISVSGIAAIVNGQKITNQELVTEFLKGGGQPMLQELITRVELEQAAAKNHVTLTPAEVDAKLATSKQDLLTRGGGGQTWAAMLASRGLSEDYARNQIRLQLLVEKLAVARQPFTLDGKVHVYHILIATTQLPFGKPPHTDADAKAQITQIAADIAAHKLTFQQAAKQYSEDASNAPQGGDLGWVSQSDGLDPAFKAAAFALKEGEISAPVKSQFGWHLIYAAEFGIHATPAELAKASNDSLDQRARPLVQPYVQGLQASANVEDLLIPLPPKPKMNLNAGGPTRIPSAPLRVNVPAYTKPVNGAAGRPSSAPPPPPL